jgi:hypothetical protein
MKQQSRFCIGVLVVLASGCAATATPAIVQDEVAKVLEDCRAKWESGLYAGLHESTDRCVNPRLKALFRKYKYPYFDLVDLSEGYRLKVSRAIDSNELSYEDGKLLMAQFGVAMAHEEQERALMSAQQRAAASQNNAHILQGMAMYQKVVAPKTSPLVSCTTTAMGETECR